MLSEVIALHIEDHEGGAWSERTAGMVKVELAEFLEIVGDRRIDQLTKDDIREYRRTLEKLPSRRSVRPEFRGKTIAEVLSLNPTPGLKSATVLKRMSNVVGLFSHAETMEWVDANPARGMLPPRPKRVDQNRDAFTDQDLRTIFSPAFKATAFAGARGGAHRYWVPLVMLFSGCRLEEAAQLHVADVVEVDGLDAIKITTRSEDADNEKKLKTAASERTIPVHSGLARLGFLEYVEGVREGWVGVVISDAHPRGAGLRREGVEVVQ